MRKTARKDQYTGKAKTKGLRLKIIDGKIVDQYGRILEEYKNSKGQIDLRPTGGTTTARH